MLASILATSHHSRQSPHSCRGWQLPVETRRAPKAGAIGSRMALIPADDQPAWRQISVDYSNWPVRTLSITRLHLDPENPRLATSVRRPTQQELIADLLEHEDVLSLMKDIGRQGFFPNEMLVAVRDGTNTIVLEGNRRLAALKLLHNPELAPPRFSSRIRPIADRLGATTTTKIPVVMAPSRAAAVPLIIARHKGEAVKRWTTIMQARFIQSRQDHGLNIKDIADETGLERSEVVEALRDAKLYDVIRSLPLPLAISSVVNDPRQFPFTTLTRLIDYSSVHQFLGIRTDEEHGFTTALPKEQFERALTRIVSDIANGTVTSRSHNTASEVDHYIKTLEGDLGKSKPKKGTKTPADAFVDPARTQPAPTPRKRAAAKSTQPPTGLIPKSFRVDIEDERIRALVTELKTLKVTQFPNAVAITYRSLLDMAVTRYLQECGELKKIINQLTAKGGKSADRIPTLKQQLNHILQTPSMPLGPEARKALQKFVSDTKDSLTLESLNWFTHVRYVPPTVEQLRCFWTMLFPLLQMTLQDPQE